VLLGILCLGHHRAHAFSAHDEELVEGLCAQLGVAIEKAGLFNERCRTATALQQALLPATLPRIPGVDLAARYRATGVGNLVGGDFYDIFEVAEETWGVILGDVCGCGPEAAALTGLARHTVRAVAAHANGPGSVLGQLNDAMLGQRSIDRFLTAIFCLVTPRPNGVELLLARGGHPCPLVLRDDGSVETPDQNEGLLVGAFPGVVFEDTRIILGPGDALVLVTDGALEARDPEGAEFGTERLESLLASCAGRSAGGIAQRVDRAVLDHQGGRGVDDLAIVVLRARPTTT
jgi:serine phosphatase RsbU (regulator of sigma subunit)